MPATKIIPKGPASAEDIDAFLGPAAQQIPLMEYVRFLRRYGGGAVFPNTLVAEQPINIEFSDPKWSVQSFRSVAQNSDWQTAALEMNYWSDAYRPIAAISGGDRLLMGVSADKLGQIFYWTPDNDGLSYRIVPVCQSFSELLEQMAFFEDQGMTPPWNRMDSIDADPAVDLDLAI
ncbi:MAG: SMI1/KNR4 family protein [Sulfitobacter sp.]